MLDILKSQELRKSIVSARNSILKDKGGKESVKVYHNKAIYTLIRIYDFYDKENIIGFNLIIESEENQEIHNFVAEPWDLDFNRTKLRFQKDEDLQKRIQKSLRFLKQIYGASTRKVIEIIEKTENRGEESSKSSSAKEKVKKKLIFLIGRCPGYYQYDAFRV